MNTAQLKAGSHNGLALPWRMLVLLLVAQLMVAFVGRSLGPLGILIGEDFSLTKAEIGLLPSALFLGQAISSIPVGFIADTIGSRKLLLALSFCLGLSFLLITVLSNYWLVLLLIVIGGIGYGAMHPTSNRGIVYWFTQRQRGTAMGIKQMGITFGSALAGLLLLPLAATFGWRPALFFASIGLLITGLIVFFRYHDPSESSVHHNGHSFTFFRTTMANMIRNKPLLLVSLSAMGLNGSQMCLNTYIVLFAYEKIGISLFLSGGLLVISEISGSFGRIGWGMISDRLFNGRRLIIFVLIAILTAITSIVVAFLPHGTSFWAMVPIVFLFGFSISGFNGVWMNIASEMVPKEQSGIASGFSITLGSLGVIITPPLFGLLVDQSTTYIAGWLLITALMAVVLVLLTVLSINMKKKRV